jgi:cellulose synthase/poly-beta-1,6-N-acetylglucosamine synthase-like glycosyltransferase
MTGMGAVLVWLGGALVVYVYLGYPLLLWLLERRFRRGVQAADITPTVTLVISAYNEARCIGDKLHNTLALDYPRDRLQVLVVSDASTDETDHIVSEYAADGVDLLRMAERGGKTLGLNAALRAVRGDVVVFSDANILYTKDALRRLVRPFADPTVGCVTGDSRYTADGAVSAAHSQEDTYWGYERFVRRLESGLGSTVGGDGAIFAIRRELYTALAPNAINDLVTPLQIVARGYRAIFEPRAVGFEPAAGDFGREFRRKRRIVNRSWHGVMSVPAVLDPRRVGLFAWQVWSHKILRWLVLPVLVLTAAGCVLAFPLGALYQAGAGLFAATLVLAGLGAVLPARVSRLSALPHGAFYFYLVNVAATLGVVMALCGHVETVWRPERA